MVHERDAELSALDAAAGETARGEGAVVVLEGPPGIGKTALLRAARERAGAAGLHVLRATASPLERDFPFGVVHQLLDPLLVAADADERARLLSGAAARAEVIFAPDAEPLESADPSHVLLHGVYWLVVAAAERGPLALVVDDLHWADRASLRFLEFLGRRLDGVPVLLVGATRPNDPSGDAELLGALAAGPSARVLRPAPLSNAAVGAVLAEHLGGVPDAAFAHAATEATGGNPFLLGQLADAAADRGLRGAGDEAGLVPGLGAEDVSDSVGRRLAALGSRASAVARAGTVLPEPWVLADVAALAGLEPAVAAEALDTLAGAGLLAAGSRAFLHPLVREAVAAARPTAEAGRLHALAARRALDRGARPEEVAPHLLATPPAGDPTTVQVLRDAARAAAGNGETEAGVLLLRRALTEPPAPGARTEVLLDLAELEARIGDPAADGRLDAVLRDAPPGDLTARARAARGGIHLLRDRVATVTELETAVAEATDPRLRMRLEATLLDITAYDLTLAERRATLLAAGAVDPDASPVMVAHLAQESAYRMQPVAETEALARRALDGDLLAILGPDSGTYHLVALAMRHAERPEMLDRIVSAGETAVRRGGSRAGRFYMEHARAFWHWMYGSVATAEAHARAILGLADEMALKVGKFTAAVLLTGILLERDLPDEARAVFDAAELVPGVEQLITWPDRQAVGADLDLLRGDAEGAERRLREARDHLHRRGWSAPFKAGATIRLSYVLAATGRTDEALAVIAEDEQAAVRAGTPGALGAARRAQGRISGDAELLEDAVRILAGAAMPLQHGYALFELGSAHRAAGRAEDAREPLRRALAIAEETGGTRLARLTRDALVEVGARPRRAAVGGIDALTPSERRVAALAVSGLSNREIAESLWVTRKTVELHLGNAYGKLGIRSRQQLPKELAASAADAPSA